ncbi:MAG: nitroreductase family protein [Deltaproteobacteria bacterium]|jgi:nitroreductase|nr:nitroreductase family protein [Deltaproteobacteria bacterium]
MQETVLENILTRRSIRKFRPAPIPEASLEKIVQAGLYAPSAKNSQPWHLTVVNGQDRLARLTAELKAAIARTPDSPYKELVGSAAYSVNHGNAPVLILVSAAPEASPMVVADCALALGYMFLAAHSLGIGSCWINQPGAACEEPGFRSYLTQLGIPAQNHVYGCGAFGFAEGEHPTAPPRKTGSVNYVPERP